MGSRQARLRLYHARCEEAEQAGRFFVARRLNQVLPRDVYTSKEQKSMDKSILAQKKKKSQFYTDKKGFTGTPWHLKGCLKRQDP